MTTHKATTSKNPTSATTGDRLSVRIAHDLGVAITAGEYQPGDKLEGEIEVSDRLNVSRTAYREAIRMLTAKGMVESRPRTGTRVLERSKWHLLDPDIIAWSFEGEPSEEFMRNLFELRRLIEPEAAFLAATRRTPRDLMRMGYALEQMEQYDLVSLEGRAADQQFHHAVLAAAKNELLVALSATVQASISWVTEFKRRKRSFARDARPDHHQIFEKIAAGDNHGAREAMISHLSHSQSEAETGLITDIPA